MEYLLDKMNKNNLAGPVVVIPIIAFLIGVLVTAGFTWKVLSVKESTWGSSLRSGLKWGTIGVIGIGALIFSDKLKEFINDKK